MAIEKRRSFTELHLRTAIEQSPLATAILDPDGRCLLVNAAWNALWGSGEDGVPAGSSVFESERLRTMGLTVYLEECRQHGEVTTPLLFREATPETRLRWLRAFIYPVRDESGALLEMGLVLEDFTERKALEDQLVHRAFHDPLTGLPNRVLFLDRLGHALSRAKREAERSEACGVALLYMDLDDFKRFNDSLGHAAGDKLLVGVAERVGAHLRLGDTFARFGGDEFAMLLEGLEDVHQAAEVAERIKRDLIAPFEVDGHQAVVTSSIGIVMAATGSNIGEDYAEELMSRADIAMYRSKSEGKDRHEVFSLGMDHSLEHLQMEEDLRRAIEREEFRVYYQPLVLLVTGEMVGFEALVRWKHPERGLLAPSEFIPMAEKTGLIVPLGEWVLAEACRQARVFRERILPGAPPRMYVNLSASQFRHPELVEGISAILSETKTDPRSIALEITESVMMEQRPASANILRALKDLGVMLVMDDFGTGYSSITNLKSFPFDVLKMDRSIVEGMDRDLANRAVVSASIGLGHALGLDVVAEGVETSGELDELRSMGCDAAQGYYWLRPSSSEKITELLAAGSSS
jgi:diguanylate cyclase (GGDEF)-like protein/PAS domain S-box-containing protein